MSLSFLVGFHSRRLDNLLQTVRFLEKCHSAVVAKSQLVVVCQDSSSKIENSFADYQHFNLNLSHMHLPYVTNYAVDHADGDKLVILESDRILQEGYFDIIEQQLQPGIMITTKGTWRCEEPLTDDQIVAFLANPQPSLSVVWENRTKDNKLGARNMFSGNTALTKSDYMMVGKMDEFYKGYGWADHDMTNTMARAGVKSIFRDELEMHLWHERATYSQFDDSNFFAKNGIYYCNKWQCEMPTWLLEKIESKRKVLML